MNHEQTIDPAGESLPTTHRESLTAKASRFLFGNDAFISYARRDATIYSLGLANQLTKKELSCFLDQWGTPSGTELPAVVVSTLKRSNMMILLGTERAAASEAVKREIIEFKKTGRTIIPVSFDGALEKATWYAELIAGISIAQESKHALETGKPSETVIDRIVNAENFTRRNKRLRNYFWITAASVVMMLLVGALAGFFIVRKANAKATDAEARSQAAARQAEDAEKKRQTAESEAERLSGVVRDTQEEQKKAEARAEDAAKKEAEATANATKQQQLAIEQKRIADEQTRIADEQQQRSRRLNYIGNMQLAQQSFEMGKTDRSQRLLTEFSPTSDSEDLRGYEWFHLWRTLHRKLVELPLGEKVTRVSSFAFSPSRKEFVTADDRSLKLWKAEDLTSSQVIAKSDGRFEHVAYSRDGNIIAAKDTDKNTVNLWNAQNLVPIKVTDTWPKQVHAIAFSPVQDSMLVTADEGIIYVWEVTTSGVRHMGKPISSSGVSSLAFSSDGKYLGAKSRRTIEIWDISFANKVTLPEPEDFFNGSIFFLPDNQTVGFLDGPFFKLWDLKTQKIKSSFKLSVGVQALPGPDQDITLALSPDGQFLAAGALEGVAYGGGVKVWDVRTGQSLGTFDGIGLNGDVTVLAFSNDGKTLAIGSKDKVQFSDATPAHSVKELQAIEDRIGVPIISADGNVLLTSSERMMFFWNTRTEQLERKHARPPHGRIVLSPDASMYATTTQTKNRRWLVQLFDARTDAPLGKPLGETSEQQVTFSPDGKTLAVGSINHETYDCDAGCLQFWDIATGTKISGTRPSKKNKIPSYGAVPILYSPNGKLLVFRNNLVDGHSVDLLDIATKRSLAIIGDYSEGDFTSFAFSPDGNTLAIASEDSTVSLWDVTSLYNINAFKVDVAEEWKIGDKHFIARLEGHIDGVTSVAFSRDGQTLATASQDGTVKLWDTRFYQPLLTLKGYKGPVDFVSFSADGRSLITSDSDDKSSSIKFWHAAAREDVAVQLSNSSQPR